MSAVWWTLGGVVTAYLLFDAIRLNYRVQQARWQMRQRAKLLTEDEIEVEILLTEIAGPSHHTAIICAPREPSAAELLGRSEL